MYTGLSRDLQIQKSSTIEVKEYINPLYTFMFLYQLGLENKKDINIEIEGEKKGNLSRYLSEFEKTSEIPLTNLTKKREDAKFIFDYKSNDTIDIENKRDFMNNETLYENKDGEEKGSYNLLMNILFWKYRKYNFQSLFRDQQKLFVFLNVRDNDVSTFDEYIKQQDIKKETKDSTSFKGSDGTTISIFEDFKKFIGYSSSSNSQESDKEKEKDRDALIGTNIFYLNVLTKSDVPKSKYESDVESEFSRLNEYIQSRFVDASRTKKIPAFRELIFFIDDKKEKTLSQQFFKTNVVNTKYIKILQEKYKEYLSNTEGNLQQGIQKKKISNQVIKNPFFDLSFKDLNKEFNILSNIKSKNKNESTQINNYFSLIYFSHFTLNEIYKEFFDRSYYASKISAVITEKKSSFNIYYKYVIQKDEDLYDIPKVIANNNFLYDLEVTGFEDFIIIGYFKTKGRYNNFKITELFYLGNDLLTKIFVDFMFGNFKTTNGESKSFFGFYTELNSSSIVSVDMKYLLDEVKKILKINENGENKINIIQDNFEQDLINQKKPIPIIYILKKLLDEADYLNVNVFKNENNINRRHCIDTTIEILKSKIENIENIAFLIKNYESLTFQITKQRKIQKFSILSRGRTKDSKKMPYEPKFYGILKRHINHHYYETFTMNRLDPKLPENSQIFYYDDLLLTKDIIIEFLKSREQFNNNVNLPSTLLSILNDFTLLDEIFAFVNENYRDNIFIGTRQDIDYYRFREKCIFNIIKILFEQGTPFYVSKMQTSGLTKTGNMKTTYIVDDIENEHIVVEKVKKTEVSSLADPIDFYGQNVEYKTDLFETFNRNTVDVDDEKSASSILYDQKKKKAKDKYISYEDFNKMMTQGKIYFEDKSFVVLEINLIPSSKSKDSKGCKVRKNRVNRSLKSFWDKQLRNFNIWTRKALNKFKTRRLQTRKRLASVK